MTKENGKRAAYPLEYKLEAVRVVHGGQACAVTARVLGTFPSRRWTTGSGKRRKAG
jgi:hypothetical protein